MRALMRHIYNAITIATSRTLIGGMASTLPTSASLASALGINVNAITDYTIIGNDIECVINLDNYSMNEYFSNKELTYYIDEGEIIKKVFANAFYPSLYLKHIEMRGNTLMGRASFNNCYRLKIFDFPNINEVDNLEGYSFVGNMSRIRMYLPIMFPIGLSSTTNSGVFQNITNSIFYFNIANKTSNGGAPDPDIVSVSAMSGNVIRYILDETPPGTITDLSISSINGSSVGLSWSAPTSLNGIDFYILYVNGIYHSEISAGTTAFVKDLLKNTEYSFQIIATDIYFNRSYSNIITGTTDVIESLPLWALRSHYKMEEISGTTLVDSVNGENLTLSGAFTLGVAGKNGLAVETYNSSPYGYAYSNATQPIGGDSFTVSTYLYRTATPRPNNDTVAQQGRHGNGFGLWINTSGYLSWRMNSTFNNYSSSLFLPLNTWVLVTFSFKFDTVSIYFDDVLKYTKTVYNGYAILSAERALFRRINSPSEAFFGRQDDVTFWEMGLTQEHVSELFAKLSTGQPLI